MGHHPNRPNATASRTPHPMTHPFDGLALLPRAWSVYAVFNRTTGRIYVGQATDARARCGWHLQQLRAGRHPNCKMQWDAWAHGVERFTCIALAVDDELTAIDQLGAADIERGYNRSDRGGWTYETSFRDDETRLIRRRRYTLLPSVDHRAPVQPSLVMSWARGTAPLTDRWRPPPTHKAVESHISQRVSQLP